ncbi:MULTISPECIES: N-6 DNA methylase [Bacillota]|uniref:N-6 DNA methylase n=2 Tax=Bacillota TaxID=1239 RepID=A0A9X4B7Q6_ENTFC|nr:MULTISPECIES: N-6 DNA methylase [Bacillota]MDC4242384.1 N-6 DNA methylase [Clostridium tertium]MDC4246145.1 N-6 DNA methylase [Clostridium perfringens]MDC4248959.1 N-6 DNA methylase [Enterococcus faecium]
MVLKNGLEITPSMKASQVISGIKEILGELLTDDINKSGKLSLLYAKILKSQNIRDLKVEDLREILNFINENILPFINDKSTAGEDFLNLLFVTFNKYVGKDDKNQTFTPDHITDFMAKITGVNKNSIILDPCCGDCKIVPLKFYSLLSKASSIYINKLLTNLKFSPFWI